LEARDLVRRQRGYGARRAQDPVGRQKPSRLRIEQGMTVTFEQAAIKVEKAEEYAELQAAIGQAFRPEKVARFLNELDRKRIRIRELDAVLAEKVLDRFGDQALNSEQLYAALTVSDRAQVREFYLSKLEAVDVALRHKFKKLYQYY
jgi:hypothetical protein